MSTKHKSRLTLVRKDMDVKDHERLHVSGS